jgi:hypothetical protein
MVLGRRHEMDWRPDRTPEPEGVEVGERGKGRGQVTDPQKQKRQ